MTLRYFKPDIDKENGKTTYLLGSLDDWRALQRNENGTADYNTLDYRLTSDIDFGGGDAMLAWRGADGGMLDFTGTLDGGEYVLSNIFEFNEGTGAKSALIESIGEGGRDRQSRHDRKLHVRGYAGRRLQDRRRGDFGRACRQQLRHGEGRHGGRGRLDLRGGERHDRRGRHSVQP